LLAYVYLKNKTFVNAHLLKSGLAEVDLQIPFSHKTRFLKYFKETREYEPQD